jgi:succinylarginine dihydrolase
VNSYLFNSQLVSLPGGSTALVAPMEAWRVPSVRRFLDGLAEGPIDTVQYVSVRQSMRNGGGPACLRLRVVLTEDQRRGANQGVVLTQGLLEKLTAWINRHYREELSPAELSDPNLLDESRQALDELTAMLNLGSIYDFQRP